MRETSIQADFTIGRPNQWKSWILPILLALVLHLLFFIFNWKGLNLAPPIPPRVEIQDISTEKLDAIRKKWKDRPILINPDQEAPQEVPQEVPKDARYSSDRNRQVEREQKARDSQVVPKVGSPKAKAMPKLKDLGVPLHLNQTYARKHSPNSTRNSAQEESRNENDDSVRNFSEGLEGGQQTLIDRDLPIGSENMLNTQESVYYSFYARLYQAIAPVWQRKVREVPTQRRLAQGEYSTVVDVTLDSEGNLLEIESIRSSGVSDLDQAVFDSWHKIRNFPNPPPGLLDSKQQIHIGWAFTVDVRDGGGPQYLPPQRRY